MTEEGKTKTRVFDISEDLKRLDVAIKFEKFKNCQTVKAVLIDPLNAYYGGGKTFDVNKSGDMRAMLTPLAQWCGDKDIAVIGLGHFNKGSNSHLLYRITDSSAITAACRSVWFAVQDGDEVNRYYFVEGKKNLGRTSRGIEYKIDDKPIGRDDSLGAPIIAPFIAWGQPTDKRASEILGADASKPGPQADELDRAVNFLRQRLSSGPVASADIESEAKGLWIKPRTLERARAALALKPYRVKQRWMLSFESLYPMPDTPESDFDDDADFG